MTHVLLALTHADAQAWIAAHPELPDPFVITPRSHWGHRLRGLNVASWSQTDRAPEHPQYGRAASILTRLAARATPSEGVGETP